jgi:hypothetical protein
MEMPGGDKANLDINVERRFAAHKERRLRRF